MIDAIDFINFEHVIIDSVCAEINRGNKTIVLQTQKMYFPMSLERDDLLFFIFGWIIPFLSCIWKVIIDCEIFLKPQYIQVGCHELASK